MTQLYTRSCKTCAFIHDNECRRDPPQVSVVMVPTQTVLQKGPTLQPSPVAAFPPVDENCWCGEYQVRMEFMT